MGGNLKRTRRNTNSKDTFELNKILIKDSQFVEMLTKGIWHIALYNDNTQMYSNVSFQAVILAKDHFTSSCPNFCSGKGLCGSDTSDSGSSGSGGSRNKGNNYIVIDDGGSNSGYDSGDGGGGGCVCFPGYKGISCNESIDDDDCNNPRSCKTLPHCSYKEPCKETCINGECMAGKCLCREGYTGEHCEIMNCNPKCLEHGKCQNGTCVCEKGWNGRLCQTEGCPNRCYPGGHCLQKTRHEMAEFESADDYDDELLWMCECSLRSGFITCDEEAESECEDGVDNDRDGLIDCLDSDCIIDTICQNKIIFRKEDPLDVSIKRIPTGLVSFYEQFKFISHNPEFHINSDIWFFKPKLVSLIRGRVLANHDSVVYNLRIAAKNQPLIGHTASDKDGYFDIIVNGGGTVTITLQAPNFQPSEINVYVPPNRRISLETIFLRLANAMPYFGPGPTKGANDVRCPHVHHDYVNLKPVIYSVSAHAHENEKCPEESGVFPMTLSVQESIEIPGTNIRLLYQSKNSLSYLSHLTILLVGDVIPRDLVLVHLIISVESHFLKKSLNAKKNLHYTYYWDKQDKYLQKIYGISKVKVSVGYEYIDCDAIFWTTTTSKMSGFSWTPMDFHKWRVNVIHAYDQAEGILHRGDGSMLLMKEQPPHINTFMGDVRQRKLDCKRCNDNISDNRLIAPVDIVEGVDGSIYVADYNFVRKILQDNNSVVSVLQLNITDVSYKYYLAVNPLDGSVFVSDYKNYRILRIKNTDFISDPAKNFEVIVGSGEQCIPGDKEMCGDGGPAVLAKLLYPKGIAINKDGVIYIADGQNVRMVDEEGIIKTVVGTPKPPNYFNPFPCSGVAMAPEVMLQWPTSLAINHLDESLHILDNDAIYRLTPESRLHVIAGRLSHCKPVKNKVSTGQIIPGHHDHHRVVEAISFPFIEQAANVTTANVRNGDGRNGDGRNRDEQIGDGFLPLFHARHLSISDDGDIFVIESNGKDVNRIIKIDSNGKLQHIAGLENGGCDCKRHDCSCYDVKKSLASVSPLNSPSSLTVAHDGTIYVADTGNNLIRTIKPPLPVMNGLGQYSIRDGEYIYVFNAAGHMETLNVRTNQVMYSFKTHSYNQDSIDVKDKSSIIEFQKSQNGSVVTVNGTYKHTFVISEGRIKSFQRHNGEQDSFTFDNELLRSVVSKDGTIKMFEYDKRSWLTSFTNPAGIRKKIRTELILGPKERNGVSVEIVDERNVVEDGYLIGGHSIVVYSGGKYQQTIEYNPEYRSINTQYISGTRVAFSNHSEDNSVSIEKRLIVYPDNRRVENIWRITSKYGPGVNNVKVIKEFKVNNVLKLQIELGNKTDTIFNLNHKRILHMSSDRHGNLILVQPSEQVTDIQFTYNPQGTKLIGWKRGEILVANVYDGDYLVTKIVNGANYKKYIYKSDKLHEIVTRSGKSYRYHYDNHGLLKGVTGPTNHSTHFHGLHSFGTYRQILKTDIGIYSRDFDSLGRPLTVLLPSNQRRVTYHYSRHGNRVSVFSDVTDYVYDFDPHFKGSLRWANITDRIGFGFHCSIGFNSRDSFVTSQTISFSDEAAKKSNLSNAHYRYSYDEYGRISRVGVLIGEKKYYSVLEYSFSNVTGTIDFIKPFLLERTATTSPELKITSLNTDKIELIKIYDNLNRLKELYFNFISSQNMYQLKVDYNETSGKLKKTQMKIGSSKNKEHEYTYDEDGNVLEVTGQITYRYGYDINGNIAKITAHKTVEQVIMNDKEQIEGVGQLVYYYDRDGFLSKRGKEVFEFDSFGKLKRAYLPGEHDVRYYYDSRHRITARHEIHSNAKVQFFYADLDYPLRLTHTLDIFDSTTSNRLESSSRFTQHYYGQDGILFGLKRDGTGDKDNYSFVVTDVFNSPTAVITDSGIMTKEIEYDPFGAKTTDTATDVTLHLGYRGGIWDPWTKFVFFEAGRKVYDTKVGRAVVPEYLNTLDRTEMLLVKPELYAHPYKWGFKGDNVFLDLVDDESRLSDVKSLLSEMGYNLDNIITPTHRFSKAWAFENFKNLLPQQYQQSHDSCDYSHNRIPNIVIKPKISLQCAFDSRSVEFTRLSHNSFHRRRRSSDESFQQISPHLPFFGKGILMTSNQLTDGERRGDGQTDIDNIGEVDVTILPIADYALSNLSTALLNGTKLLEHRFHVRSKDVHHFVQEEYTKAQQDIMYLNLRETGIIKGLNVTVHKNESSKHAEIRLLSNHTIVYLKYGVDAPVEMEKVLKHAKIRALEEAWEIERELSRAQKLSVSAWSKEQREMLKNTGRVSGVQAKFIRNVLIFPELIDDPKNIMFESGGKDDV